MKKTTAGERKTFIGFLGAILAAFLLLPAWNAPAIGMEGGRPESKRKYNVVLITVNGLRYKHLGSSGYARPTTPAIDGLAEGAFVFTKAFAQNGYTMPNMMTMFTSLYPESHGVMDAYKDGLSPRVRTIAEIFRENGYRTAGFWQKDIAHLDPRAGFGRGFEQFEPLDQRFSGREALLGWMLEKRDEPFFLVLNTRHTHLPYFPLPRNKELFPEGARGKILDDEEEYERAVYRKIVEAIRTPGTNLHGILDEDTLKASEWLLDGNYQGLKSDRIAGIIPEKFRYRIGNIRAGTYLAGIDPGDPENLKYLKSLYDACVLGVDQELVKPILRRLEEVGIAGRTIVIVTGDHGVGLGEHGILDPSTRYYEELIHVPLIIKVPGSTARREVDDLVQTVDLMPTILELSGIPVPPQAQGRSLLPLMEGRPGKPPNDAVMGSNRVYAFLRTREWKLIVRREHLDLPLSDKDELFHLTDDPEEKVNLRDFRREVYNRDIRRETYNALRKRIREHLESIPRYPYKGRGYTEIIDDATSKRIRETGYW